MIFTNLGTILSCFTEFPVQVIKAVAIWHISVTTVVCFEGPSTWAMASGKPDVMMMLLNKLLDDGNVLYKVCTANLQ